jgi:hypothetical protein
MQPARDLVVTSFSPAGAVAYGHRCVESLRLFWPHPIEVYLDEPMPMPAGVMTHLTNGIPGWAELRRRLPRIRAGAEKPTNYIWDAQRFAVKPFVWLAAAERLERGVLTWLDADTVVTAAVPAGFAADLLGDADVAYLGRGTMHPETGFVIFRIPEALPLLRWCVTCYTSGAFKYFDSGWTDCHVIRQGLNYAPAHARDLTSHLSPEWTSSVDAFGLSPIGRYAKHLKGPKAKREACIV